MQITRSNHLVFEHVITADSSRPLVARFSFLPVESTLISVKLIWINKTLCNCNCIWKGWPDLGPCRSWRQGKAACAGARCRAGEARADRRPPCTQVPLYLIVFGTFGANQHSAYSEIRACDQMIPWPAPLTTKVETVPCRLLPTF